MNPEHLSSYIADALVGLEGEGSIRLPEGRPSVVVERPRQSGHGDYATNIAMQLGKRVGLAPRALAQLIADRLTARDDIAEVEVAGPGFLNVTAQAGSLGRVAVDIVAAGDRYGRSDELAGERINLEFVSANPTGPLHLGGVRWAAVGDALGRIFTHAGAQVTREYYFNDHGAQIDRFSGSLFAEAQGRPMPDDGYGGAYIADIAAEVLKIRPDALDHDDAQAQEIFREVGVDLMFAEIKQSLADFGVAFDVWFHEDDLHRHGAVTRAVDRLTERGVTYEQDGALWLRSEDYGDDKDRVIIKSDGRGAYLSGDLAYYLDKRDRGFDRCLIMLGADHHGYVGRMMAMTAAFGDVPGENLEILIGQLVNLVRDGQPLRMSKRAGTVVTIDDLVGAIGVDAARYALARYSSDSAIDIDLDLWSRAGSDNPVYYVQYAHARVSALLRNGADFRDGLKADSGADLALTPGGDGSLLVHPREGDLLRVLAEFPRVVATAARLREPHRVARYLEEVAGAYHRFYDSCRVLPMGDEEVTELHRQRLLLVDATRVVLAQGLDLLGVSAPERM